MNLYGMVGNNAVNWVDYLGWEKAVKPAKPCKKNGKIVKLTFDGMSLKGSGFSTPAVSGAPTVDNSQNNINSGNFAHSIMGSQGDKTWDYSKERQKEKNKGPAPEGSYWIDTCKSNSWKNATRHKLGMPHRVGWGSNSWHMQPDEGNEMYGRDSMFVHGGSIPGSAGCIDTFDGGDAKLQKFLKEFEADDCCCYVTIVVKYKHEKITGKRARYTSWKYGMLDTTYDSGWHFHEEKE